ncbi:MAG: branched-chain-amino-acid transaminase [Elusimicrobia bacterium]|nr:branched-chain-amino-acid transaminase [Elusimicrobiota bacterium]
MKIYIDGEYFSRAAAKVSVFDHGLLYGDGVFEGIRAYAGRILRLEDHLRRLKESADAIYLALPMPLADIGAAVVETVRANKLRDAYIRLLLTRGVGDLGLDMRKCRQGSTLIVIADKIELYPAEVYEKGLTLITSSYRQKRRDQVPATVKSLNYLLNVLARAEATRAGAQEAILLNAEGQVTECTGDNIFFVVDGRVSTPPVSAGLLEGVTRRLVMELVAEHMGHEVAERETTVSDLCRADEVFLTGTGAEVVGGVRIDGHVIGGGKAGPVTKRVIALFRDYAREHGTPVYPEPKKR